MKATRSAAAKAKPAMLRAASQSLPRCLDDRVDQDRNRRGGEDEADAVGRRGVGIAGGRDADGDQEHRERGDGGEGEEDTDQSKRSRSQPPTIGPRAIPTPVVAPQRPIARARSRRSVKTLVRSERVAGKIRAAPMPIAAGGDQLAGGSSKAAREGGGAEDGQSGEEDALSPNPVAEIAGRQDEGGEHQVVGIDDPFELDR